MTFLWPVILLCLVLSIHSVYLRVPPCVYTHLLVKLDSIKETYEKVGIAYYKVMPPLFCSFCTSVVGTIPLTLRMENTWSLSLIWAGHSSFSCYFEVSVHRGEASCSPCLIFITSWCVVPSVLMSQQALDGSPSCHNHPGTWTLLFHVCLFQIIFHSPFKAKMLFLKG